MPYISRHNRQHFDEAINKLGLKLSFMHDIGNLNYALTSLVNSYLTTCPHYADYNAAIGVLECMKLELYRRRVAEYEDGKCSVNGDVFPPVP